LEQAGFSEVRTVLASGNVVLSAAEDDPEAIAARVHAVIQERFGFDIAVLVASLPVVREAVDEYPFPRTDDRHAYVVFAEDRAALGELVDSVGEPDPEEEVRHGEDVLYWDVPKGRTLDTRFGKQFGKRQRSGAVTTRNINTLEKILAVG
jgi:uncharacterized protein (DUF1697 family)